MDERYITGYGTKNYPFLLSETFTYADLFAAARPYSNPTQNPTMLYNVDALDVRRPVAPDSDDD